MNPYNTLGVKSDATIDEIKASYRKLAQKHHPDREGGNAEKFKEVQKAYDTLSDPEKRAHYDEWKDGPNSDDIADQLIAQVLMQMVDSNNFDLDHTNMITEVKNYFHQQMKVLRVQIKSVRSSNKKLRNAGKRLKSKSKHFQESIYARRLQGITQVRAAREQYAMGKRVIARLVDYRYDADYQEPSPIIVSTAGAGGVGGNGFFGFGAAGTTSGYGHSR